MNFGDSVRVKRSFERSFGTFKLQRSVRTLVTLCLRWDRAGDNTDPYSCTFRYAYCTCTVVNWSTGGCTCTIRVHTVHCTQPDDSRGYQDRARENTDPPPWPSAFLAGCAPRRTRRRLTRRRTPPRTQLQLQAWEREDHPLSNQSLMGDGHGWSLLPYAHAHAYISYMSMCVWQ
jgi:hypothetical protein